MKIIWLGHGSFRIEIEDQVLLLDPWLTGNPVLPEDQHEAAVAGGTHLLLTHGHVDHSCCRFRSRWASRSLGNTT